MPKSLEDLRKEFKCEVSGKSYDYDGYVAFMKNLFPDNLEIDVYTKNKLDCIMQNSEETLNKNLSGNK